jgi:hypothetical protein
MMGSNHTRWRTRGELLEIDQSRWEWRVHASSPGEAGTATGSIQRNRQASSAREWRVAIPPSVLYLTHDSRYQARAIHVKTALRRTVRVHRKHCHHGAEPQRHAQLLEIHVKEKVSGPLVFVI